jgi:hypothetical protein
MALGGLDRRTSVEHDPKFFENSPSGDVEKQPRKMSRISKPASITADESDTDISVGAQIELEKENAIQYRTCSWPKVRTSQAIGIPLGIPTPSPYSMEMPHKLSLWDRLT